MYHLLFSIILKTIDPYYRRHLTKNSLNPSGYLYLETFIYTFMLFIFIGLRYLIDTKDVVETFENLEKVEMRDICIMSVMSFFFIYSTLYLYNNEHKDTVFTNSIILRCGSLVGILLVGIFLRGEKYTLKQSIGIMMSIIGVYLLIE